jgi:AcrR family transcriptional regulator
MADKTRSYKKKARARAEETKGRTILDAALQAFSGELFDRVTLQQIATASGVTVQTVIRRFGTKEELFEHLAEREGKRVLAERAVPARMGLRAALDTLVAHYERDGDMMTNFIHQEHLSEPVRRIVSRGRRVHREWVEIHCRDLLTGLFGTDREHVLLAAIAATDLYTWKLLRRDHGLEPESVAAVMHRLIIALGARQDG